jgi:TonB family protein
MRSVSVFMALTVLAACSKYQPPPGESRPDGRIDVTQALPIPKGEFGAGAYRPGQGIVAPVLLQQVDPPPLSQPKDSDVETEVIVLTNGTVGDVRVIKSTNPAEDEIAKRVAAQWKFRPALLNGKPVNGLVNLQIHFPQRHF